MSNLAQVMDIFKSFQPGPRLIDGGELQQMTTLIFGTQGSAILTALAGGGAVGAPVLGFTYSRLDVVANANDSVLLPQAIPGSQIILDNEGAQTAAVFAALNNPVTGIADQVIPHSSIAAAASATQASGILAIYVCSKAGFWKQGYSA